MGRIARPLVALLALLTVVVAFVATPLGRTRIVDFVLRSVPLAPGHTLTASGSAGNVFGNLSVFDLRLTDPGGNAIVQVDTAAVSVRILPLLSRTVSIDDLRITSPVINTEQRPDGTWSIVNAFPVDTTSSGGLTIRIGAVALTDGQITARHHTNASHASVRDSVLHATDVMVVARDIVASAPFAFDIQMLQGHFTPPGQTEPAFLQASASYRDGAVRLDTLSLVSPRTTLAASGQAAIAETDETFANRLQHVQMNVQADPLSLVDLAPFLPSIDSRARGRVAATILGSPDSSSFRLDANFGTDGVIAASGGLGIGSSKPVHLDLKMGIESFRMSLIDRDRFTQRDVIDGTISADLDGAELAELSGSVSIALQESRIGTVRLTEPRLAATFSAGNATYRGSLQLAQQLVTLNGTARPFDNDPTYNGTVTFNGFDVSRLGNSYGSWPSRLTGTLNVDGTVRSVDGFSRQEANASMLLSNSSVNQFTIEKAQVDASLSGNTGTIRLALTGAGGNVQGRASVSDLETQVWRVDEFNVRNLNVAALLADTTTLVVTGAASASGRNLGFADMQFDGTMRIDSASYNVHHLTAVDMTLAKRGPTLVFTEQGQLNGATIETAGTIGWSGRPRINISEGSVSRFDIGQFVRGQTSDFNGTFSGDLAGESLTTIDGRLSAQLSESRLNATTIAEGRLTAEIVGSVVSFDVDAETPAGGLALSGSASPFETVPSYRIDNSAIRGINIGAIMGVEGLRTRVNGTMSGALTGTSLATLRGDATISFDSSTVNGAQNVAGTIKLTATDTLLSVASGLAWAGDGSADLVLIRRPSASGVYQTEGTLLLNHFDIGEWTGSDSVSSDVSTVFAASYTGKTLATAVGSAKLTSLSGRYHHIDITAGAGEFLLDTGTLAVETLAINTSAGTLLADGTVAILNSEKAGNSNLSVDAAISSLKPIGELIPRLSAIDGKGRFLGQVTGPPNALYLNGDLHLEGIEYKDRRVAVVNAIIDASFDANRKLSLFDASGDVLNVILPTMTIRETVMHAALVDSVFQVEAISTIDDRRTVRASGVLDPREDSKTVTIDDLAIRLDQDRWALLQPSVLSYGDGIRIKNLLLFTDDQQIALDGIVDLNGDQSLILTVENFRIASVADLLDYQGLGGTANGYLDLTGPAAAPIVMGDLSVDVESDRKAVGDMQLSVRYDSLQLFTDATFRHVDGSTLTIDGSLPIDLRLARSQGPTQTGVRVAARQATPDTQVDLTVVADSFSMGWMLPFLDKQFYDRLGGKIDGTAQIFGTVRNPSLAGSAKVLNGDIGLPTFGIHPGKINADLEFDGSEIRILKGTGVSGSGTVRAVGKVNLSALTLGEFDISLTMDKFLAMDNATFGGAKTTGDLLLYGDTQEPHLSGYIRMDELDIYYVGAIEEFEPVQLTEEDQRDVERIFGRRVTKADTTTFSFYDALQMDINIEMQRNTWLRSKQNPRLNIEFTGDMDMQKEPNSPERMFGTINVLAERSTIDQFGRRFDIESGTVTYNGDFDNPNVDITANYSVKSPSDGSDEVSIELTATGTLQNLEIELSSDPQMELTDILSYVLTGRPAAESLQFSSGEAGLATDIALSQATGYLEGLAGSELGLDVVRIENDGAELKLTAGKYIRNGVYLAISQPVVLNSSASGSSTKDSNGTEFTIEVEIIRDLLARLLQQDSGFKLTLFWKYAY